MLKPLEIKEITTSLTNYKNTEVSYPHGKTLAVYKVNGIEFAYLDKSKQLLSLSLRSDQKLAEVLRSKYEEVFPASKLNPKQWNTIVLSGQLAKDEVMALIDHSYQLAIGISSNL